MGRNIVIVDDNGRLALHVWQYLSGGLAFGIGEFQRPDIERLFGVATGGTGLHGLPTPAHDYIVWWIDANRGQDFIESELNRVLASDPGASYTFLLDVRGPRDQPYQVGTLLKILERSGCTLDGIDADRGVVLLSAYSKAFYRYKKRYLRILEKSPETLHALRTSPRDQPEPEGVRHILITGAGFELPNPFFGEGNKAGTPLGIPKTDVLIREALTSVTKLALEKHKEDEWALTTATSEGVDGGPGFPYPSIWARPHTIVPEGIDKGVEKSVSLDTKALQYAAKHRLLDLFWNELLELELRHVLAGEDPARTERKMQAWHWEFELRDAFRRVFLKYDWGYLNQAVDAARQPFGVWLSTNYTGFANRAIELTQEKWRVVATANEAARLLLEILHGTEAADFKGPGRFLFKLHGDIAHLTTMAIAGHDKEIYSPLSLPIDSLHQIYVAAEQYLLRMVQAEDLPVVWHIVGHGLGDRLLCQVLARTCRGGLTRRGVAKAEKGRHTFIVVNPFPKEALDRLETAGVEGETGELRLTAEEYMACLRNRTSLAEWKGLRDWKDSFPAGSSRPAAAVGTPARREIRRSRKDKQSSEGTG